MPETLFLQNVIAVIWDFDNTLVRGYMQEPLFRKYGVSGDTFWLEVNKLPEFYQKRGIRVSPDTVYLNHILTYVQDGTFGGLNNKTLEDLGAELTFFEGLPEFFKTLKESVDVPEEFKKHDIHLEHYVVSTGLKRLIKGSAVARFVEDIWGCEFIETPAPKGYLSGAQGQLAEPVVGQIGYVIDNTTKTRAIFEINKGTNKFDIDVNAKVPHEQRRVPFQNMIYVADGPSDIPSFSVINQYGGKTFAVYDPPSHEHFRQGYDLQAQGRVQGFGPADYRAGSHTYLWLLDTVRRIALRIVQDRTMTLTSVVRPPPHHIVEPTPRIGNSE